MMANGVGGFTEDGREYVISLQGDAETPAPWSNILANPQFGIARHLVRRLVHLVGEQPREPPDAVRQRPGERSDGGGDLLPRR